MQVKHCRAVKSIRSSEGLMARDRIYGATYFVVSNRIMIPTPKGNYHDYALNPCSKPLKTYTTV